MNRHQGRLLTSRLHDKQPRSFSSDKHKVVASERASRAPDEFRRYVENRGGRNVHNPLAAT